MEKPAKSAQSTKPEPIKNLRTQVLDTLRQRFIAAGNKVPADREEFFRHRPYQANIRTILLRWIEDLRKPTADPAQARDVIPVLLQLLRQLTKEMAKPVVAPVKVQRAKYLPKRRVRRAKSST